jgi:hypothetical protein
MRGLNSFPYVVRMLALAAAVLYAGSRAHSEPAGLPASAIPFAILAAIIVFGPFLLFLVLTQRKQRAASMWNWNAPLISAKSWIVDLTFGGVVFLSVGASAWLVSVVVSGAHLHEGLIGIVMGLLLLSAGYVADRLINRDADR